MLFIQRQGGGLRKYFGLRTKATDVHGKSFIKSLTKVKEIILYKCINSYKSVGEFQFSPPLGKVRTSIIISRTITMPIYMAQENLIGF